MVKAVSHRMLVNYGNLEEAVMTLLGSVHIPERMQRRPWKEGPGTFRTKGKCDML